MLTLMLTLILTLILNSKLTMQAATYGKSAEIRSRIEPDLKKQSTEVLADLGLDLSGAIRLFLRQVVEVGGLPFEVKKPSPATVAAMMEARAMSAARFDSAKEGGFKSEVQHPGFQ